MNPNTTLYFINRIRRVGNSLYLVIPHATGLDEGELVTVAIRDVESGKTALVRDNLVSTGNSIKIRIPSRVQDILKKDMLVQCGIRIGAGNPSNLVWEYTGKTGYSVSEDMNVGGKYILPDMDSSDIYPGIAGDCDDNS